MGGEFETLLEVSVILERKKIRISVNLKNLIWYLDNISSEG